MHTAFRREWRLSFDALWTRGVSPRVGLLSHDGVSPRASLVITRPLSASVYLTFAAFRCRRLLSSHGHCLAADFRCTQRFAASGVYPLTPLDAWGFCLMMAFRRARLLSSRGHCPPASI